MFAITPPAVWPVNQQEAQRAATMGSQLVGEVYEKTQGSDPAGVSCPWSYREAQLLHTGHTAQLMEEGPEWRLPGLLPGLPSPEARQDMGLLTPRKTLTRARLT